MPTHNFAADEISTKAMLWLQNYDTTLYTNTRYQGAYPNGMDLVGIKRYSFANIAVSDNRLLYRLMSATCCSKNITKCSIEAKLDVGAQ